MLRAIQAPTHRCVKALPPPLSMVSARKPYPCVAAPRAHEDDLVNPSRETVDVVIIVVVITATAATVP